MYLVDFGSVQTIASKDGGTITIVGSYGYIPLEQFGGQTTTASDLYSLAIAIDRSCQDRRWGIEMISNS